ITTAGRGWCGRAAGRCTAGRSIRRTGSARSSAASPTSVELVAYVARPVLVSRFAPAGGTSGRETETTPGALHFRTLPAPRREAPEKEPPAHHQVREHRVPGPEQPPVGPRPRP